MTKYIVANHIKTTFTQLSEPIQQWRRGRRDLHTIPAYLRVPCIAINYWYDGRFVDTKIALYTEHTLVPGVDGLQACEG